MMKILHLPLVLLAFGFGPSSWAAQQELPEGISLLEDRELAGKIQDAQDYLSEERWAEAVSQLQEVADANPASVIDAGEGFFLGAAMRAREILAELPEVAQEYRRRMLAERAEMELEEASFPPDPHRLALVHHAYDGTPSADRARALLRELWRDRGQEEMALSLGAPPLPPDQRQALPTPAPTDVLRAPSYDSLRSAQLPQVNIDDLQLAWRFQFRDDDPLRHLGHRLAFGYGLAFASNGHEVAAIELGSGRARWHFPGPPGWEDLTLDQKETIRGGASPYTLLAPVLSEGILLAVVQEPVPIGRADEYRRIDIRRMMPARRLYAFDARDGSILWRQDSPWLHQDPRQPLELPAGPPTVHEDKVYLPVFHATGTVDLSLLCFELRTGRRLWKTFLTSGTMETNLFGNILSELACPPPLVGHGQVYLCSHFGTLCAIDADSGLVDWIRTYPRTEVRTRQNGTVSPRPHYLRNNPMALDGDHLVVAPNDSYFAFCIDAKNGDLTSVWNARTTGQYGTLAHLLGTDRSGAWFSGTHITHLPFQEDTDQDFRFSQPLYEFSGDNSSNLHLGALTRDGIVAMSSRGAFLLDPESLAIRDLVLDRQDLYDTALGPMQATHGFLLMMTHNGITAMASPQSFLRVLTLHDLEAQDLEATLAILESMTFPPDRKFGRQVSRRLEELRESGRFPQQEPSLRYVEGRTRLLTGEEEEGLELLDSLLAAPPSPQRRNAAALILDLQAEMDAGHRRLARALDALQGPLPERLTVRQGGSQPTQAILARANALRHAAEGSAETQHASLTEILMLTDCGELQVLEQDLRSWAQQQLQGLLADADLQHLHEKSAKAYLAEAPVEEGFLRAYAGTSTAQDWLSRAFTSPDETRPDRIELLSWAYRFGAADREWPQLQEFWRLPRAKRSLPTALKEVATIQAPDSQILQVLADGDAALVFLQERDRNLGHVLRISPENSRVISSFEFFPGLDSLRNLKESCYPTEQGVAIVHQGRWLHVDRHGVTRSRRFDLPEFDTAPPLRLGNALAVLLRRPNRQLSVEVLDLITGQPIFRQDLEAPDDRFTQLIGDSRWLFVLQQKTTQVLRIDLHREGPVASFHLPFVLGWRELLRARVYEDGLALPAVQNGREAQVVVVRPNRPAWSIGLGSVLLGELPVARGLGWWTRPSRSQLSSQGPLTLYWLGPGMKQAWSHALSDRQAKVPLL